MSADAPSFATTAVLPWISLAARVILGGVVLYAGLIKIVDLPQSVVAVKAYKFPISDGLATFLGNTLPVVEILLGLAILAGLLTRWTALLGGLMMVVYIAAIASAWARGLSIDCGCLTPGGFLGPDEKTQYGWDIARDVGLIVCAVWLIIFPASRFSADAWIHPPHPKEP